MCNSKDNSRRREVVKAGSVHKEKGGFHIIELNSPINMSGSTVFMIVVIGCIALGWWLYRRDKRQEKKRERREGRMETLEGMPRSNHYGQEMEQMLPLLHMLSRHLPPPIPIAYNPAPPRMYRNAQHYTTPPHLSLIHI